MKRKTCLLLFIAINVLFSLCISVCAEAEEQVWKFTSSNQTVIVTVNTDGAFNQTNDQQKWYVRVTGCMGSTYPLTINGEFRGDSVTIRVSGEGCGGQSKIEGHGTGKTRGGPFPDARSAEGDIDGIITYPLTETSIDSADSIARLRDIVSDVIQGQDFDRMVEGKSLMDAKYSLKKMVSRPMDQIHWSAIKE